MPEAKLRVCLPCRLMLLEKVSFLMRLDPPVGESLSRQWLTSVMGNAVKDEGLKNLMMAWYYAGYYTGLHEGQQRASRQPKTDPHQGVS